ncbi:MAG: hypothetical protein R3Y40_09695 [Eubacteriales bacterium]
MKNNNTRNTMMLIAGGYLVYLGYTLVADVIAEEMDNEILFLACGIVFILAGVYVVISRGKDILTVQYDMEETEESDEDAEELDEVKIMEEIELDSQEISIEEDKEK